ncbi:tRNA pseudouridine55 synthase [Salirhabdus euzebyi]|uniref:tRNA pseudouridine synthase B n=1 Tax=Salirhabdus euzebyi TaxID=394506 RepID=A0A841Q3B4_9BACI|nr:tRNA pseudouridine(55) synthase TruB [Salirhabdus euzebyi]MBB6452878.1 tRNA pseudouridine55 synthase [Salirhabdus euzebyi]
MDGILPLWKPKGMTSHDCVYFVRRLTNTKKVGHTGTLDPEVEGVLPICIGQATKISSIIMDSKKVYEAEVCLGFSTETEDREGAIVEKKLVDSTLTLDNVKKILPNFIGEIEQVPPMYSAVKVKGKKLYEYAREGKQVERPSRFVTIHAIDLLSDELKRHDDGTVTFSIRISCSKGTYIRTLCVDIGKALDYPAHMSHLIRTESGSFTQEQAVSVEELKNSSEQVHDYLKNLDYALSKYDVWTVNEQDEERIRHGSVLPIPEEELHTNPFRVKTNTGVLLALYQLHPSKTDVIKPFKMFTT